MYEQLTKITRCLHLRSSSQLRYAQRLSTAMRSCIVGKHNTYRVRDVRDEHILHRSRFAWHSFPKDAAKWTARWQSTTVALDLPANEHDRWRMSSRGCHASEM